uniref:Reverse transcriptase domain-containing protein n=1 Tax=Nothobranchius furzeri TaxID=105023 RepID=A0A1A8UJ98_NOTFU
MGALRFVSWNVHGAGSIEKRLKIFDQLKRVQADVILLQETHRSATSADELKTPEFPSMFSACYNSRQRGVAILIHKNINFTVLDTVSDPEGRFIMLKLSVQNQRLCIVSIYCPNIDDPPFFHNFFSVLSEHLDCPLILGGDFNFWMNSLTDRLSTAGTQRNWQSTNIVKQYMSDYGLCDAWRSLHPNRREYTFFSHVHHSHSRLDYFLVSSSLLADISDTEIHPIVVSDHAPVSLTLVNKKTIPPSKNWRFNTSLLKDEGFIDFFKKEWALYLEHNDLPGTSASILWEAGKAVMRGKIISFSSHKKKTENKRIQELEEIIKSLEASTEEELLSKLRKAKLELHGIIDKKTQFLAQRLRIENFEHSNKSGKFLASQLKINKEKTTISAVKDSTGNIVYDPERINNTFRDFYQTLYSPQINPSDNEINEFLDRITLPKLSDSQVTVLDSPLTSAELQEALKSMTNRKAPGPDGFPVEFYKEFWIILAPTFFRMVREIEESGRLQPNMNSANISLLLKPGKDPAFPTSYRPISLINVDLKIICKALAKRLEKVTPFIIHPDQTGFIKGRQSSTNSRRLLNLIDFSYSRNIETSILSLDAEKAFDRVNWKFLFATLHKFGFGNFFINWLQTLYSSPTARVRTNDQISASFCLQRGTRQGCPLSPSLFAIFIEPLAAAIRQTTGIKGIKCKKIEHKISLYADDVLLFLQNSQSSLSQAIELINSFSRVSDYSINWLKSTVLPINFSFVNLLNTQLESGNITYLGINVSPKLADLTKLNYIPLLKKVEDDLARWKSLPISLMGRVATIKMMVLPRINYLFSMIPNKPPADWFKSLDSSITKFLWQDKPPRISLKTLQKTKDRGGLDLPNFYYYFLANRLQYIPRWLQDNPLDESWLDIEQTLCNTIELSDLPFISSSIRKHEGFKSISISTSLTAWWEYLKMTESSLVPCRRTPIWNNPDILQNNKMMNLPDWKNKGILYLEHIYEGLDFIPFNRIVSQFGIDKNSFLEYHQIKSVVKQKFKLNKIELQTPPRVLDFYNLKPPKLLSKVYKTLSKIDDKIAIPIEKWEVDLSVSFDQNFWSQTCLKTFKMIRHPNLQLIQYKILHRVHYTGHRMFKMGFVSSDTCTHCTNNIPDNYIHALWSCPPVQEFWGRVCEDLSKCLKCHIPTSPSLCLLGNLDDVPIETSLVHVVLTAICIAKKTILLNWKNRETLCINQYRNLLLDHITLDLASASTSNQSLWAPLIGSIT